MTIFSDDAILHHATKSRVNKIAASLVAEYPALSLSVQYDTDGVGVAAIVLSFRPDADTDFEGFAHIAPKEVPGVAQLAELAVDEGFDPEAMPVEYTRSGSVVDETYRVKYRENSTTGRSCGDWLAEWFATETIGADNKTNIEDVHTIFDVNGLDMSAKWALAKGAQGWQGRFRMNGRQVLEKLVAKQGFVLDASGNAHDLPKEAWDILCVKHAKWLAKEAKRDQAQAAEEAKALEEATSA